jgi:hypothetical protein
VIPSESAESPGWISPTYAIACLLLIAVRALSDSFAPWSSLRLSVTAVTSAWCWPHASCSASSTSWATGSLAAAPTGSEM